MGLGPRSDDGCVTWHTAPCATPGWSAPAAEPVLLARLAGEALSPAGELCRAAMAGEVDPCLSSPRLSSPRLSSPLLSSPLLSCLGSCDCPCAVVRAEPCLGSWPGPWPGRGLRSGEGLASLGLLPPPAALRGGGRGMRLSSVGGKPERWGPAEEAPAPEEDRSMVRPMARRESRMREKGGRFLGSASQHTWGVVTR